MTISLLLALVAQSVDSLPAREETVRVTISGSAGFDGVARTRELVDARGSFSTTTGAERATGTIESDLNLRLSVSLLENVDVGLLLRNERLPSGGILGANPEGLPLAAKEAWVRCTGALDPRLGIAVGAMPFAFDIRGRGSSFFFDPARSESILTDINQPFPTSTPDTLTPAGIVGTYTLELFTFTAALYPAIIEGGSTKNDESAYAFACEGGVASRSRWGAIAAFSAVTGGRTSMLTVGGGFSWREWGGFEIFAEGYAQIGDRFEVVLSGQKDGLHGTAHGATAGIRWESASTAAEIAAERQPSAGAYWVEVAYVFLGNDHDVTDGAERRFLSYESVRDLIVLEDPVYGLDLDTNYSLVKVMGGMSPMEHVRVSMALGFMDLSAPAPYIPSSLGRRDDLGYEVDARISYDVNAQVTIHVGGGVIVGSGLLRKVTSGDEDRAGVGVIGVNVRW